MIPCESMMIVDSKTALDRYLTHSLARTLDRQSFAVFLAPRERRELASSLWQQRVDHAAPSRRLLVAQSFCVRSCCTHERTCCQPSIRRRRLRHHMLTLLLPFFRTVARPATTCNLATEASTRARFAACSAALASRRSTTAAAANPMQPHSRLSFTLHRTLFFYDLPEIYSNRRNRKMHFNISIIQSLFASYSRSLFRIFWSLFAKRESLFRVTAPSFLTLLPHFKIRFFLALKTGSNRDKPFCIYL